MSDQTPNWAMQLAAAVIYFEEVHPKTGTCLAGALGLIPENIKFAIEVAERMFPDGVLGHDAVSSLVNGNTEEPK